MDFEWILVDFEWISVDFEWILMDFEWILMDFGGCWCINIINKQGGGGRERQFDKLGAR